MTVVTLGFIVYVVLFELVPILLKLIDNGKPDFGSTRAGVYAMITVGIIWVILIMWGLFVVAVGDPGFVT